MGGRLRMMRPQALEDLMSLGMLEEREIHGYIARQDEAIAQAARRKMAALDALKIRANVGLPESQGLSGD